MIIRIVSLYVISFDTFVNSLFPLTFKYSVIKARLEGKNVLNIINLINRNLSKYKMSYMTMICENNFKSLIEFFDLLCNFVSISLSLKLVILVTNKNNNIHNGNIFFFKMKEMKNIVMDSFQRICEFKKSLETYFLFLLIIYFLIISICYFYNCIFIIGIAHTEFATFCIQYGRL